MQVLFTEKSLMLSGRRIFTLCIKALVVLKATDGDYCCSFVEGQFPIVIVQMVVVGDQNDSS